MSTKDLFDKNNTVLTKSDSDKINKELESLQVIKEEVRRRKKIRPEIDYSDPKNFAKYGSAKKYYEDSFSRISKTYPYDGSQAEISRWLNDSSDLDIWILQNVYPRYKGHVRLSRSQQVYVKGYANPEPGISETDPERLSKQYPVKQGNSNIWDPEIYRNSNIYINGTLGNTVEFWAKFDSTTLAEQIVPLVINTDNGQGGIRLAMWVSYSSATGLTLRCLDSGGQGFNLSNINPAGKYNNFFEESWNHYAFSFSNTDTGSKAEVYKNGQLIDSHHHPNAQFAENYYKGNELHINGMKGGQFSVDGFYIDEFRFWKTRRTEQEIGRHWFCNVTGGTNTDDDKYSEANKNVDLGIYYKFNEGITGIEEIDEVVLDYSGRISNAKIINYSSHKNIRRLESAIDESANTEEREQPDPVLYSANPNYVDVLKFFTDRAMTHDMSNNSSIYHTMPGWITDEDSIKGENIKELTQVLSSFFDDFHLKVENLTNLGIKKYYSLSSDTDKPNYLSKVALASHGFEVPDILTESSIIEDILSRSEQYAFEERLEDVKNTIYQNIYNNLSYIYKSKGTEKSFRNLIRCFGIDEELLKINLYANNSDYNLQEDSSKRNIAVKKNFVDFGTKAHAGMRNDFIESKADPANQSTSSVITGAGENWRNLAITLETEVIFPKRIPPESPAYLEHVNQKENILSLGTYDENGDWVEHVAVWADKVGAASSAKDIVIKAKFLTSPGNYKYFVNELDEDGGEAQSNRMPVSRDVYDNSKFNIAVRLKPAIDIPETVDPAPETIPYKFELYFVRMLADVVEEEFLIASSEIDYDGTLISMDKTLRLGQTSAGINGGYGKSFKVSSTLFWYDCLSDEEIKLHASDGSNYGRLNPFSRPYTHLFDFPVTKSDTLALHWDFNNVSTTDEEGDFVVQDLSDGITDQRFDWFTELVSSQVTAGAGENENQTSGFDPNDNQVTNREFIYSSKHRVPGVISSTDLIEIGTEDYEVFTKDTRPAFHFFTVEKSMYQIIDDDILNMFASIVEFNNLIGQPVNRYRMQYKSMNHFRQKYFETVKNVPSLEKYVEYYKWLDTSIGVMIRELIPVSSDFAADLRTMVESHVLERNKYWNKFPTLEMKQEPPEGQIRGINELTYNWKIGHGTSGPLVNKNAMSFVSNGDGVVVPYDASMSFSNSDTEEDLPFSVTAWVKPDTTESGAIISRASEVGNLNATEWNIFHTQGRLSFILQDDSQAAIVSPRIYAEQVQGVDTPALTNGVWQNVTVTYDGSKDPNNIKFFVNGVEILEVSDRTAEPNYTFLRSNAAVQTVIGGNHLPNTGTFEDQIADVCLYNKKLTAAEVLEVYNGGRVKDMERFSAYDSIISWWKMGDDLDALGDSGIRDYVGTNHGTAANTTTIVKTEGLESEFGISEENVNCLWEKERVNRTDPIVSTDMPNGFESIIDTTREHIRRVATRNVKGLSHVVEREGFFVEESKPILRDNSNNTYEGSTYVTRRLSEPYRFNVDKLKTIRAGVNYSEITKDPNSFIRSSTKITSGTSGIELEGLRPNPQQCFPELPNRKYKRTSKITVKNTEISSSFSLDGLHLFPMIGDSTTDLNAKMQNIHTDSYGDDAEIPLQGPFAQQWVGGNQHRHVDLLRQDNRPELYVSDSGVFRHPQEIDSQNTAARYLRDETAKRPINIKNIKNVITEADYQQDFEGTTPGELPPSWTSIGSVLVNWNNDTQTNKALAFTGDFAAIPSEESSLFNADVQTHWRVAILNITFTGYFKVSFRAYEGVDGTGLYGCTNMPEAGSGHLNFLYLQYSEDKGNTWKTAGNPIIPDNGLHDLSEVESREIYAPNGAILRWVATGQEDLDIDHWAIDEVVVEPALSTDMLGNYTRDYEIVQTSGRRKNNQWFIDIEGELDSSFTDSPYITGIADYELPNRTRHEHIISERFSAPGDPLTLSRGFLDRISEEYSVYNSVNYRNKEDRDLHHQSLYVHSDLFQGSQGYEHDSAGVASVHKTNRNRKLAPIGNIYDNAYISHQIPRSDSQYGIDYEQRETERINFNSEDLGAWSASANGWRASGNATFIREISGERCLTLSGDTAAIESPPADTATNYFGFLEYEESFDSVITVTFNLNEGYLVNPGATEDLYFQYKLRSDDEWTTAEIFPAGSGNDSNYTFNTNSSYQSVTLDYGQTYENPISFRWVAVIQQAFGLAELWAIDDIVISKKDYSTLRKEASVTIADALAPYSDYRGKGWRFLRSGEKDQVVRMRKNNQYSVLDPTPARKRRADTTSTFVEPPIAWHKPLKSEIFTAGELVYQAEINLLRDNDRMFTSNELQFVFALGNKAITQTYSNNLEKISNYHLAKRIVDINNNPTQFFDTFMQDIKEGLIFYKKLISTEIVYPKRKNVGLAKVRVLPYFDSYVMFWREKYFDRIKRDEVTETKLGYPITDYFRKRWKQQYTIDNLDNFHYFHPRAANIGKLGGSGSRAALELEVTTSSHPLTFPHSNGTNAPFSVSGWFNINSSHPTSQKTLFTKKGEWFLNENTGGFIVGIGNIYGRFPRGDDGNWVHFVFAYNGGQAANAASLKGYINGQEVQATSFSVAEGTNGNFTSGADPDTGYKNFVIGSGVSSVNSSGNPTYNFFTDAKIHNLAVYNEALSAETIRELYRNVSSRPPSTVAHWQLTENGNATVDSSLNLTPTSAVIFGSEYRALGDLTYIGKERSAHSVTRIDKDTYSESTGSLDGLYGVNYVEPPKDIRPKYQFDVLLEQAHVPVVQIASPNVKESQGWASIKIDEGGFPTKLYEQQVAESRLAGQNYSVVPEYCISEHMDHYMLDNDSNFLVKNYDFLTLRGASYDGQNHTRTSARKVQVSSLTGYRLNETRGIAEFPTSPSDTRGFDNCASMAFGRNNIYAPAERVSYASGSSYDLTNSINGSFKIEASSDVPSYFPPIRGLNASGKFNLDLNDNDYLIVDLNKFKSVGSELQRIIDASSGPSIATFGGIALASDTGQSNEPEGEDLTGDGIFDSYRDATPFMMSIWAQPEQVENDTQSSQGILSFGSVFHAHAERGEMNFNPNEGGSVGIRNYSFSLLSKYTLEDTGRTTDDSNPSTNFKDFGITFSYHSRTNGAALNPETTNPSYQTTWTFFHKTGEKAFLNEGYMNHVAFQVVPPRLDYGLNPTDETLASDYPYLLKVWLNGEELYGVNVAEFLKSKRATRQQNQQSIMSYSPCPISEFLPDEVYNQPYSQPKVFFPWVDNYATNGLFNGLPGTGGTARFITNVVLGNANFWSSIVDEFADLTIPSDGMETSIYNRKFRGLLDEFSVHKGIHTTSDIQRIYNNGTPTNIEETVVDFDGVFTNEPFEEYDFASRKGKNFDLENVALGDMPVGWESKGTKVVADDDGHKIIAMTDTGHLFDDLEGNDTENFFDGANNPVEDRYRVFEIPFEKLRLGSNYDSGNSTGIFELSFAILQGGATNAVNYKDGDGNLAFNDGPSEDEDVNDPLSFERPESDDKLWLQYKVKPADAENYGSWTTAATITAGQMLTAEGPRPYDLSVNSIYRCQFISDPTENHEITFRWVTNADSSAADYWGVGDIKVNYIANQSYANIYDPFENLLTSNDSWKKVNIPFPNELDFSLNWSAVSQESTNVDVRQALYARERTMPVWHRLAVPFDESQDSCKDWDDEFFNSYVHTNEIPFVEQTVKLQEETGVCETSKVVNLKVSAIKKLIPYDGFYPQDRTVQIAKLFIEKLDDEPLLTSARHEEKIHRNQAMQAVLQHFFAPGILYNSLKAGVACDWACYTNETGLEPSIKHDFIELSGQNEYLILNKPAPSWYLADHISPLHSDLNHTVGQNVVLDFSEMSGSEAGQGVYFIGLTEYGTEKSTPTEIIETLGGFVYEAYGVDKGLLGSTLNTYTRETNLYNLTQNSLISSSEAYLISSYGSMITKQPNKRLPFDALLDPVRYLNNQRDDANVLNVPKLLFFGEAENKQIKVQTQKTHYFFMNPLFYNYNSAVSLSNSLPYPYTFRAALKSEMQINLGIFGQQPTTSVETTGEYTYHSSSDKVCYPYFDSTKITRSDTRYEMAMHNFLAEIPSFFLLNESISVFESKVEKDFKPMSSDKVYTMAVNLYKTDKFAIASSLNTNGSKYFGPPMMWKEYNETENEHDFDSAYAAYAPPYMAGLSQAIIQFEPSENRRYTLEEILSGAEIVYSDTYAEKVFEQDIRKSGSSYSFEQSPAYLSRMPLSSSIELLGTTEEKKVVYDVFGNPQLIQDPDGTDNLKKWVIYPKFEAPILNYYSVNNHMSESKIQELQNTRETIHLDDEGVQEIYISSRENQTSAEDDNRLATGLWSGIPEDASIGSTKGVFMEISDPDDVGSPRISINQQGTPVIDRRFASLADIIGMPTVSKRLGSVGHEKVIEEAVVMIPFYDVETKTTVTTLAGGEFELPVTTQVDDRHFIKIDSTAFENQVAKYKTGLSEDNPSYEIDGEKFVTSSITRMLSGMKKYNLPPRYDFMKNNSEPFAMYFFEFKQNLTHSDLINIWQGVEPKVAKQMVKDEIQITHPINRNEFFGNFENIPENIRWMVFKVKKKAKENYYDVTASSTDDDRYKFIFSSSGNIAPSYSYNYPYDFFTMLDRIKIEAGREISGNLEQQFRKKYPTGEYEN